MFRLTKGKFALLAVVVVAVGLALCAASENAQPRPPYNS